MLYFQLTLGLIGSLMGVIALIGLAVNANSISSLSKDQDSICTTVNRKLIKELNVLVFYILKIKYTITRSILG